MTQVAVRLVFEQLLDELLPSLTSVECWMYRAPAYVLMAST